MVYVLDDTELDLGSLRRAQLQSALRKFATTVSGSYIDLNIVTAEHMKPYGNPPAWSDATTINLWHDVDMSLYDTDNLVRLKGLTIHELGHVLFTPRDRTQLGKKVADNRMWNTFNILEDNRIDNMMVARLSGVAPWLLHTVLQEFYHDDESDHTQLLPLVWGRKYIPKNIRDLSAQVYKYQDNVADIKHIIDQYICLNMARKEDANQAYFLISELHNLLYNTGVNTPHGDTSSLVAKNGGSDMSGIREQDTALNKIPTDTDTESEAAPPTPQSGTPKDELTDNIKQAVDKAHDDMYEDIKTMVQGMRSGVGSGTSDPDALRVKPAEGVYLRDVEPASQLASRQFGRALTELKTLFDPAWVSRQSEGRLNAREFLVGADIDESFDMWDDGRSDVSDIECVLLLDISGSMGQVLNEAYDAMWSIKRALDSINASTTVVTFGDYSRVLYDAHSRAGIKRKHSYDGSGGTNPVQAVKYARDVLLSSGRALKLFVAITDGQWYDANECDNNIAELRHHGVMTGIVHITDEWLEEREDATYRLTNHNCEVIHKVDQPSDIIEFARKLVQTQQRNLLR